MVGFGEDPITGEFPSRTPLEEEEEFAKDVCDQYRIPPQIEGVQAVDTAIFLLGRGPSILANTFLGPAPAIGTIQVPEFILLKSPLEEDLGVAHPHINTCTIRATTTQNNQGITIIECPQVVPPEQANIWASTVLAALSPKSVLIVAPLLANRYVGPGSVADEDLIFSIQTTDNISKHGASVTSQLPPGNLIDGLPAALLQQCEVQAIPATALLEVEHSPVPDSQKLCQVAAALTRELTRIGALPADFVLDNGAKGVIAGAVDNMYRSSVSNSMFI